MAEIDDILQEVTELRDRAQGYISDAEFREEYETRQLRYLQATSNALVAIVLQNSLLIDMMRKQQENLDGLGGR